MPARELKWSLKIAYMKRINKIIAILFGVVLFTFLSNSLYSQSSASVDVQAEARIVSGIAITNTGGLAFGKIVRSAAAGTVVLDPSTNQLTTKDGVSLGQNAGFNAAYFTVNGEPGYNFQLAVPSSISISNGAASMNVEHFTTSLGSANQGMLNLNGSLTFSIGATLKVEANQSTGTYAGSFTVTAAYQ